MEACITVFIYLFDFWVYYNIACYSLFHPYAMFSLSNKAMTKIVSISCRSVVFNPLGHAPSFSFAV